MARRERKVVTVLFADLAGFTSRAEAMDPEDVAALLDPYQARLKAELERFGGTVEKFIGDAVMAIFGAPVSHEDDAERAVRAALRIRDWAADESVELRVGINSGEALVTIDAKATAGETMAAGDVVNTAARLQSAAPIGEILVGEQTFRATSKAIDYVEAEPVVAKGKAQPLRAWQAVSARARATVERVQGATLVGRQRELDMLTGALDRARQERSSQLVTLVGVPGIGKSRLVVELYGRIERETDITSWRHGRCLPYGDGVTFWALAEMVKAQAGILEDDDETETARKLRESVGDPWIESHMRTLVGLPGGAEGGGDRRDEAFTAWRRFFESLAEERPLVLVFEDLHWADDDLLDFIDHLIDWATGVPLLVVCAARPELLSRRPGWGGGKSNAITISLSPLSDAETTSLILELLERSLLMGDAQAELLARAGGNPLYAEEYVRVLRERGQVEQLPETVQGMIAARLDLLDAGEKALIQDAAVIGKSFWLGALVTQDGQERRQIEERLHVLERKEFVRRERSSSVAGDVEYSFRHVLFRDVAYGQIPRAERAEKHRRAAEWMESLGRPEDHSEMLAHHYMEALELCSAAGMDPAAFSGRAATALTDAGARAFRLNAFAAASRYDQAAIAQMPPGDPRRASLLLHLGTVRWLLGDPDVEVLERARDEFLAMGNIEGAAEAETRLVESFWLSGERDAAFAHLERARALLADQPPSPIKAHAIVTAARYYMLASDNKEAIRFGEEALRMAEDLDLVDIRVAALINMGKPKFEMLSEEEGSKEYREAIRLAEEANLPYELVRAKNNFASMLWEAGRFTDFIDLRQQAVDDAERFGQLSFIRWLTGTGVLTYYAMGDWDAAMRTAEDFLADVEAGRAHYLAAQVYCDRARIRLGRDDLAGALADIEPGLELGRKAADPQVLLPTLSTVAHVALATGDAARASSLVSEFLISLIGDTHPGFGLARVHELSWTATPVGRGREIVDALGGNMNPWARAAVAFASGDPVGAADICAEMGVVSEEMYDRLQAGKDLIAAGRIEEGLEQARRALAFYRSVGATRYIKECEALLSDS